MHDNPIELATILDREILTNKFILSTHLDMKMCDTIKYDLFIFKSPLRLRDTVS